MYYQKNPGLMEIFQKLRRKVLWKFIYNKIYYEDSGFLFQTLNYGYAEKDYPDGIGSKITGNYPPQEIYGYQLYSKVLSYEILCRDSGVLEVGCGTGHGLADQAAANPEVEFTGLDLSPHSVKRAKSTFSNLKNLEFVEGNAVNLPFEDETFDLVLNIESSHCYIDLERFFSEVDRVLKPGGTFLVADFRQPVNYEVFLKCVQKYLKLVKKVDITENVLRSLKKLTPYRKHIFNEYFKKRPVKNFFARNLLERFSGIEGTTTFERFRSGYWRYFLCVLKKTDDLTG